MADTSARLVPNCKVLVDGSPLDPPVQASLVRLSVDLDSDLFGQSTLLFADPHMKLIGGDTFACGAAVKVKLGYGANLEAIFDGEVVRLEPQFRKDQPISLAVVCQEPMHRLALTQSTRSLNDVDVSDVVTQIAQQHGFSSDAPSGTKQHIMQGNVSNAVMLRRLASRLGMRVRVEAKKLIMSLPPSTDPIPLLMKDGIRKVKVRVKSGGQVSEISVHGWDAKNKQEFVGSAKPQGEVGQGGSNYGDSATISDSSGDNMPPDQATAEAMAKGRMQKRSEGYIKSQTDMIGDARMIPGQKIDFDKMGPGIDGTWRIERASHDFSKRGYFVKMEAVRISAKKPAPPAPPVATTQPPADQDAAALMRPRWKRRVDGQNDVADMAVDANKKLEGKSVKFVLETKVNGAWKQVATANGTVTSGTATATATLDKLDASGFTSPKWTSAKDSQHLNGDTGQISISSTAKDGVEIRVILEQQVGKGWERIAQKIGSVSGGAIKSSFALGHPNAAEAAKDISKLLKVPSWTQHPQVHGGSGAVQVRAPGLPEGRAVQFDVQSLGADGTWKLVRTVQGSIDHGTATAPLPDVRHPAHNVQPAHADVLKNPTWAKGDLAHGVAGTFSVEAPNLDGRMVAFILERNDNNTWTQLVRTLAKVSGGKAQATASFAHPTALVHKPKKAGAKPTLSNPRWGTQQLSHGDAVQAIIDASGLEGATIEFVAERKEIGGWTEAGRATGKVSGGKATATITVEHPTEATDEAPDTSPTVEPKLINPRWESQNFNHGDQATAIVDVQGLDGATIEFVAERLETGGWVEAGRGTGVVSSGQANAIITLKHASTDTSLRQFRFRSAVRSNPRDALKGSLNAKYDAKTGKVTASTGGDHEGRQVRFVLERREATGWVNIGSATARASKGIASATLPTSAVPGGALSAPRWGKDKLLHGDLAELVVDAKGLDGQKVKFVVERLQNGGWTGVGAATVTVSGGQAQAKVPVSHPTANSANATDLSKLRFSAALVDQIEVRARAQMLPDHEPRQLRFRANVIDDPNDKPGDLKTTFDPTTGAASAAVAGGDANRMVRFILEEKRPVGWIAVSSMTAKAVKGQASVKLPVHHKANAKLSSPRWGKQALLHGDQAQVVVDAQGLDGHSVKFTIERLGATGWTEAGNVLAQVARGQAIGSVTVHHPKNLKVSQSKLRFRVEQVDPCVTRVRAEMLPDIAARRVRFRAELIPDHTKQKLRFVAKPVPDLTPKRIRFRGELPVPLDPALTRLTCSADGADDVQTGGSGKSGGGTASSSGAAGASGASSGASSGSSSASGDSSSASGDSSGASSGSSSASGDSSSASSGSSSASGDSSSASGGSSSASGDSSGASGDSSGASSGSSSASGDSSSASGDSSGASGAPSNSSGAPSSASGGSPSSGGSPAGAGPSDAGQPGASGSPSTSGGSPAQNTPTPTPAKQYSLKLACSPASGFLGDTVKLTGTTDLPDGTNVRIVLQGSIAVQATVSGGALSVPWVIDALSIPGSAALNQVSNVQLAIDAPGAANTVTGTSLAVQEHKWIRSLYVNLLGRAPEPAGFAFWINQAKNGSSASSIADGFFNSVELSTNRATALYRKLLGREPDAPGLASWSAQLEQGKAYQDIVTGFLDSVEYKQKNPVPSVWVESLYQNLLGRASDPGGKANWVNALKNGSSTASVISGFLRSQEYATQRVTEFYQNLLGRQPEAAGLAGWVKQVTGGASMQSVEKGFVCSPEYWNRVNGLIWTVEAPFFRSS